MRIAMQHHHLVHRHAKSIGHDLGKRGLVALALCTRPGDGRDAAGLLDANQSTLEARAGAGFDKCR